MTKEDLKVEMIYLWNKNKGYLFDCLAVLTFPIWLPILILFLIFGPDVEDDERWCEEHGYVYPDEEGWGAHKIVCEWKKEYKKKEKDLIRSRLKEKEKIS